MIYPKTSKRDCYKTLVKCPHADDSLINLGLDTQKMSELKNDNDTSKNGYLTRFKKPSIGFSNFATAPVL